MEAVRPAAVAGLFYPESAAELRQLVERYLRDPPTIEAGRSPKALIAPHAGYVYSGPIAASAFRTLAADAASIERIVLLGPAHRVAVRGLALPGRDAFATPLGVVPVDREQVEAITSLPQVSTNESAHAPEHCLEVELPFLQVLLGSFSILPLLVSSVEPADIAEVLDAVWGGPETRVVVSSDLSHYLSYAAARDLDRDTARRVVALEEDLEPFRACGAVAINGLTHVARAGGFAAHLLDLRNSGDTAGDRLRVVGYGSFSFSEVG